MVASENLLAQAEQLLDQFEFEEALKLCQEALENDAGSLEAIQMTASTMIELGMLEDAKDLLLKAVSLAPDSGFEKYLALGQLCTGFESLGYYSKAASLLGGLLEEMSKNTNATEFKNQAGELTRQLSNIYCSAAELYLTDLCFEEGAETECEALLSKAREMDPTNPEPLRIRADLKLSQEKNEEAAELMKECLKLWVGLPQDSQDYPSYEQRTAMAKILIELGLCQEATDVLENLLAEDEQILETWYLLGVAQKGLGDTEGLIEAFVSALALLCRQLEDDLELKESIFGFLTEAGIDAEKVWSELVEEMKESGQ